MVKTNSIDSSLAPKSPFIDHVLPHFYGKFLGLFSLLAIISVCNMIYGNDKSLSINTINVLVGVSVVYLISSLVIDLLSKYPGNRPQSYLLITLSIFYIAFLACIVFLRIEYARFALVVAFPVLYFSLWLESKVYQKLNNGHYGVIPRGFYEPLVLANVKKFSILNEPCERMGKYKGIIVDKNEKLDDNWQRFIAHALSEDIPVFDTVAAYESITGKSPLDHYGEIASVEMNPRKVTLAIKRIIESLLIIMSAPVWLLIILITAIAVKLESNGPAFFIQKRVGRGGREFRMFKIRSMCLESEQNGAQFATNGDPRITKVGGVIRKTRIDELPQFFNILLGDMSLIGPRPEQASFVNKFEDEIPLYSYRHVVRPGITGWAQVTQGYASTTDETREKLAHDFYYVKNLGLLLDLDIALKTIKTMLTGFGAR